MKIHGCMIISSSSQAREPEIWKQREQTYTVSGIYERPDF